MGDDPMALKGMEGALKDYYYYYYVMPYVPLSVWHAPGPAPAVSAACARDPIGAFNLFVQGSFAQAGVSAQQPLEAASCCG